jgi:hypothetical protein
MSKKYIFFAVFYVLSHCVKADIQIPFLHPTLAFPFKIDLFSQKLEKLNPKGTWDFVSYIQVDSNVINDLPDYSKFTYLPNEKNTGIYFFEQCTNKVFLFDLKNQSFKRLDQTYYRGNNCRSYRFLANNTIYSLGGYGFWQTNNLLTYFDKRSDEWEAVNSLGTPPKGIFRGYSAYLPERKEIISFSNFSHHISENGGKLDMDNHIYRFSFAQNKWEMIGDISLEPIKSILTNLELIQRDDVYYSGQYFLIQSYHETVGVRVFYFINPRTLAVSKFEDKAQEFSTFAIVGDRRDNNQIYRSGPYIFNFLTQAKMGSGKRFFKVNMDELAKRAVFIGYLTDKPWYFSNWFLGFLLLTIFAGIFKLWYNRRLFLPKSKKTIKETAFSPEILDDISKNVIHELLNHVDQEGIDVITITDLLGLSELAPDAQRYKRSALINELNGKLALLTHCNQTILRIDSSLDRRQKRYVLDPSTIKVLQKIK